MYTVAIEVCEISSRNVIRTPYTESIGSIFRLEKEALAGCKYPRSEDKRRHFVEDYAQYRKIQS